MIRAAILLLFLMLCSDYATAQPRIVGATEYPAHTLVRLRVTDVPEKTGYLWKVYPPGSVDKATTAKDTLQFAAPPGVYTVEVFIFAIDKDGTPQLESVTAQIVIGSGPGPTPPGPTPPGPTPPGPTPDDLTKEIKQLYDADSGANKQKVARQLAALYRWGSEQCLDKNIPTAGALDAAMFNKAKSLVESGLDNIRQRVADKCKAALGGSTDPRLFLDDERRKTLSDLFVKLAKAMEDVSK